MLDSSSSSARLVEPFLCDANQLHKHSQENDVKEDGVDGKSSRGRAGHQHLFSGLGLQLWLLVACQDTAGLRDKPGKPADWYHSCYCLSGLSLAQEMSGVRMGGQHNALQATDPRLNVLPERLSAARRYFSNAA